MHRKYRALRIISLLGKIASIVVFLLGIIGTVAVLIAPNLLSNFSDLDTGALTTTKIILAIAIFLLGILVSLALFANANMVDVRLATEENTRATVLLLQRLTKQDRFGGQD